MIATRAPRTPPTDATTLTAPPVNDIGLLDAEMAVVLEGAVVVGVTVVLVVDGIVVAVVAGAAAAELVTTATGLEVAIIAAAEVVALAGVLAGADATQAQIELAACWTARPVTAPHPFTTHSRAALLMAATD